MVFDAWESLEGLLLVFAQRVGDRALWLFPNGETKNVWREPCAVDLATKISYCSQPTVSSQSLTFRLHFVYVVSDFIHC